MSTRISEYIRNNVLGLIAIYLALGGISVASHGAPNSIDSADIINGEVRTGDIGPQQVRTLDVARDTGPYALTGDNIAADTITDADIAAAAQFNGATAGGDLEGSYPGPTIAAGAVSGGAGGEVADNTITGADVDESTLSGVPLSGAAGGDLTGNYPDPTIAAGAVSGGTGGDIVDGTITGADVADTNSLTGTEIFESGLTVGGDLTGTVANAQIGGSAVDNLAIAADAVGTPEIAADAVGTSEVASNALGGADIFEGALGKVPSATSADFAAGATNANNLDGLDSSALVVGRSDTADDNECTGSLPEVFETCADVSITFPHAGRAMVVVTAGFENVSADGVGVHAQCQLQVDETTEIGVPTHVGDWADDDHPAEVFEQPVAMHALTDVLPAGSHPFEFNCKDFDTGDPAPDEADIDNAYISAVVIGSG